MAGSGRFVVEEEAGDCVFVAIAIGYRWQSANPGLRSAQYTVYRASQTELKSLRFRCRQSSRRNAGRIPPD